MMYYRIIKTEPSGFFDLKYRVQWAVSPKNNYDWNYDNIYCSLKGAEKRVHYLKKIHSIPVKKTVVVKEYD